MAFLDKLWKAPPPRQASSVLALAPTGKPNDALCLPEGLVPSDPGKTAIITAQLPASDAAAFFDAVAEGLAQSEDICDRQDFGDVPGQVFTLRTPLMRYPDLCYVSVLGPDQATGGPLGGIYSHSVYGHSDMGANAKRLRALVRHLGGTPKP